MPPISSVDPSSSLVSQAPRFVAEVKEHDGETVLDPDWEETPEDFSDATVRELMRQASAFYDRSTGTPEKNN
jgi:hypothetical protein